MYLDDRDTNVLKKNFQLGYIFGVFSSSTCSNRLRLFYKVFWLFYNLICLICSIMHYYHLYIMYKSDQVLSVLHAVVYGSFYSFNISVLFEILHDKKYQEIILNNLVMIDLKIRNPSIKYNKWKISTILFIYISWTVLGDVSDLHGSNLVTTVIALHRLISFSQIVLIQLLFWFTCHCLRKRYDKLNEILLYIKLKKTSGCFGKEIIEKIESFKRIYKQLYETNQIVSSAFEKYLLNIFLISLSFFLWVLNYVHYSTQFGISWKNMIICTHGMTLLVSITYDLY